MFNFELVNSRVFDVDVENFGFVTLEELYEANGENAVYRCTGFYINTKSDLVNEAPVATIENREDYSMPAKIKVSGSEKDGTAVYENRSEEAGCYVNLPVHQLHEVKAMIADEAAVNAINQGGLSFTIRKYFMAKYSKWCYAARWMNTPV